MIIGVFSPLTITLECIMNVSVRTPDICISVIISVQITTKIDMARDRYGDEGQPEDNFISFAFLARNV